MAEREAFSLKNTLVIYNFLLVILSGYMLIEVWFITPKSVASVSINACQKGKFSRQVPTVAISRHLQYLNLLLHLSNVEHPLLSTST